MARKKRKIFADAELDESAAIRRIRITGSNGKLYFMSDYDRYLLALEEEAKKDIGENGGEKK